jgi:hypothetical protein
MKSQPHVPWLNIHTSPIAKHPGDMQKPIIALQITPQANGVVGNLQIETDDVFDVIRSVDKKYAPM